MESDRGTRGVGDGKLVIENFVPSSGWTDDSKNFYLLVDLPGFKKEQVRIQVLDASHVKVAGEKATTQNKSVRFEQTYKIPGVDPKPDMNKVIAKLDGEILYITVPKKPPIEEPKVDQQLKEEAKVSISLKKKQQEDVINEDTIMHPKPCGKAKNKDEITQQKPKDDEEEEMVKKIKEKAQQKANDVQDHDDQAQNKVLGEGK